MSKNSATKRSSFIPAIALILSWVFVEVVVLFFFYKVVFNYEDPVPGEMRQNLEGMFMLVAMVYFVYILPSIIMQNRRDFWKIFTQNFFLGWVPIYFILLWGSVFLGDKNRASDKR